MLQESKRNITNRYNESTFLSDTVEPGYQEVSSEAAMRHEPGRQFSNMWPPLLLCNEFQEAEKRGGENENSCFIAVRQ